MELIVILILVVLLVSGIKIFNTLIADRNQVKAAWSDIDVQLKRRHDLVPMLVEAVRAYSRFEKSLLTSVTELRAQSERVEHLPEKAAVEDDMARAINSIIVIAEDYPELKADQNFRQLQTELVEVEDHLQHARRFYNGAVRIYNTHIGVFPHLLIAKPFRFMPAEFFEVSGAQERQVPGVAL